MKAYIFCDMCTKGKLALRVGDWVDKGRYWRYVESVMPEGNCADWADLFWDTAYDAIYKGRR